MPPLYDTARRNSAFSRATKLRARASNCVRRQKAVPMRILIAEDDAMNRDMIARRMRWEGHTISLAIDGAEALHLARTEMPDLILLDMGLPKQNGWDVARQLKSDEATRHIPIIALTAYALPEDRVRGLASGCDAYELKPIDFERLLLRIRALTAGDALV